MEYGGLNVHQRPEFRIGGVRYVAGTASGASNNCLIASLSLAIDQDHVAHIVEHARIREELRGRFPDTRAPAYVAARNFLTFDLHAMAVIEFIGRIASSHGMDAAGAIVPASYTVRCIVERAPDEYALADSVGSGPVTIYLLNHHNVHSDPLIRVRVESLLQPLSLRAL